MVIPSFVDEMKETRTSSLSAEAIEMYRMQTGELEKLVAGSETIQEYWRPAKAALAKHSSLMGLDNGELFDLVGEALDALRTYAKACQKIERYNAVKSSYP